MHNISVRLKIMSVYDEKCKWEGVSKLLTGTVYIDMDIDMYRYRDIY